MALPSFTNDDYDNDDFDWEAAVREIDSACQGSIASNSEQPRIVPTRPPPSGAPLSTGRQSTLDRFVHSYGKPKCNGNQPPRSSTVNTPVVDPGGNDDPSRGVGGGGVGIDLEAAKTWIYPVNIPLREYQLSIAKSALFSNTLVALPTGLGKTLIAAVVMYNYYRWFPEGKIVFTAPSRPLVMQQIEACHNIVGIPQEWTIDMTGQMAPPKRSIFWKAKRVFFVTPQVLEKDIQSGICNVKQLVCLVIDEAHRASGNYSYCVAVRELMSVPVQLRILALTATPGSKQMTIQTVIDNLCISTLEYRDESDNEVIPYVHNRKLELIQVPMTKDSVDIDNLLLEVIKPFITRLSSIGVLHSRDSAVLSPCALLASREKFRQAPPQGLPQAKYGEVEGCYGVLITLYHIRKLLSSHGIRPAYDMLEEKLCQGSFARTMSRNETVWKAKLLMQQSLSHGAPNPKLVKMIAVLIDHFKTKDPKSSRVIIFSNFRGSVKDIMDSLSNLDDIVRATEFIGQSSGKSLKGQTQKVQQAVIQKFRSGGYNVIVATSIGEEGLDIMEVDLVICFDANISPLRMIQRMGRTGRKHDGRVVVLASEGSELKGYLKKQSSSNVVRKHMHNGGTKSFGFHPSPRMVPHICKPEVQYVELSIEQFVPRGRKVKDDVTHVSPSSWKISDEQSDLLAKYFHPSEDAWKPSLIAFPNFQAFPSTVHKVRHSFRTTAMLIDAMQHLAGLSFSKSKNASIEVETSRQSFECIAAAHDKKKDPASISFALENESEALIHVKVSGTRESFRETSDSRDVLLISDSPLKKPPAHCFLFGEEFVTVDALGSVQISLVPVLPLKRSQPSKDTAINIDRGFQATTKADACLNASGVQYTILTDQLKDAAEVIFSGELKCVGNKDILLYKQPEYDEEKECLDEIQEQACKQKLTEPEDNTDELPRDTEHVVRAPLADDLNVSLKDTELSPRLTHLIEEGIVPESPMVRITQYPSKMDDIACASITPMPSRYGLQAKYPSRNIHLTAAASCAAMLLDTPVKNESVPCRVSPNTTNFSGLSVNNMHEVETIRNLSGSPVNDETNISFPNPVIDGSSENWQLNSGEDSKSLLQAPKYKRLRRHRDIANELPYKCLEDKFNSSMENTCGHTTGAKSSRMKFRIGKKEKLKKDKNTFVEEEAEVSKDAEVSEDEEENGIDDEYDDSFINDRTNPSETSNQEDNSGDMMAFYRRSLLTQSPGDSLPSCPDMTHESFSSRTAESGSCSSGKICHTHQTPQLGSHSVINSTSRNPIALQSSLEKTITITVPSEAGSTQRNCSSKLESRKRKLSFQPASSDPATAFRTKHSCLVEQATEPLRSEADAELLCDDDDFFQGLDLDAVEAQATELLRCIPESSHMERTQKELSDHPARSPSMNLLVPPSFDLGI